MIIASCRHSFSSTKRLAKKVRFREYVDAADGTNYESLTLDEVSTAITGRRICLLIHGFNTTLKSVLRAYAELQSGLHDAGLMGADGYGLVIGFAWPGWNSAPGYFPARKSANRSGLLLRKLLQQLQPAAAAIDVQTHSLGARVALSALRAAKTELVRNLLLSAPAVDRGILAKGRMFHNSLKACQRCLVYYSRRDKVLRHSFPLGDLADGIQQALGLAGPQNPKVVLRRHPNLYLVDASAVISDHSGYRHSASYFAHWRRVLDDVPLPRQDSLAREMPGGG